jgi:uncharacterized RDD family membrane protein YckC
VIGIAAGAAAAFLNSAILADLILVIGIFVTVFGYFWVSEAMWSGQTLGKKAFRLRAVGDRGEPLTWVQAGIRNVVRIIDFLPYGYGVGAVVMFANGKGKRLGDLAAGTIVVKDSDHVWLWQLPGARPQDLAKPVTPPPLLAPTAAAPAGRAQGAPSASAQAASQSEYVMRSLDPELRRFVTTYARRRPQLTLDVRVSLASTVQDALRRAQPGMFEHQGPLATLDYLADVERA